MCCIIDANKMTDFADASNPAAKVLHSWIRSKGKIAYTTHGTYGEEEERVPAMAEWLKTYASKGYAREISHEAMDEQLRALKGCKLESNDCHILALARASRARVLYSSDQPLCLDFKDRSVVPGTKARMVYSSERHKKPLFRIKCP